jgi:LCP family protein required for cell wall assembly
MSKPRAKPSAWKKALGAAFYLAFCIVALGLGVLGFMVRQSPILLRGFVDMVRPADPKELFNGKTLTLLVLGCDEDLSYGGKKILRAKARSDMMLVAKLDFEHKRIGGISIPRDLEVQLPGYRSQKINAYHSFGGPDLAKQAAEQVLGIQIDRVVELNYDAFQDMVNIVGGVNVYVPKNMKYTDKAAKLFIDFKKGRQHMDGYQAMCFVRFRHSDSDFMRMDRQRDFMLALRDSVMHSPGLAGAFSTKAAEVLGGEMNDQEIVVLTRFVRSIGADNIKMANLPTVSGSGTNLDIDQPKFEQALSDNYLKAPSPSTGKVSLH